MPVEAAPDLDLSAKAMVPVHVRREWFAALYEENCLKIRDLLVGTHGRELVCMWPDEREAKTVGYNWKGWNALHVAVKQGWTVLVVQILDMFDDGPTAHVVSDRNPDHDSHSSNIRKLSTEKLKEMILAFDGKCKLDAIAISILNGDEAIAEALAAALLVCGSNPYEVHVGVTMAKVRQAERQMITSFRDDLRKVTDWVLKDMTSDEREAVELYFAQHNEFNFLNRDYYLFHALCSVRNSVVSYHCPSGQFEFQKKAETPLYNCRKKLLSKALEVGGAGLVTHIFQMKDSRGRTPLHIAVDHDTLWDVIDCLAAVQLHDSDLQACLNATDRAGRTGLHRAAAALNISLSVQELINHPGTDLDCGFDWTLTKYPVDLKNVSLRNGFGSWIPSIGSVKGSPTDDQPYRMTPLHFAVFNPYATNIVDMLLRKKGDQVIRFEKLVSLRSIDSLRLYQASVDRSDSKRQIGHCINYRGSKCVYCHGIHCVNCQGSHCVDSHGLAPLGLAALAGNIPVLRELVHLKATYATDRGRRNVRNRGWKRGSLNADYGFPALHLAAAVGDSEAVETILRSGRFNIDHEVPKLLHRLMRIPLKAMDAAVHGWTPIEVVRKNLLHVVNFRDGWCKSASLHRTKEAERYSRQACVNLLLRAGASIWYRDGQVMYPVRTLATSPEFRSWWSERVERETQELRTEMRAAATGITVTAALVTTASFMGPLQPPMGYGEDDKMQLRPLAVKYFIIFNTLAFYISVATIVLSMYNCNLPIRFESLYDSRRSLTSMLNANNLLIGAILCLVISFTAATMAVIPGDWVVNSRHAGPFMTNVLIGVLIGVFMVVCLIHLAADAIRRTNFKRYGPRSSFRPCLTTLLGRTMTLLESYRKGDIQRTDLMTEVFRGGPFLSEIVHRPASQSCVSVPTSISP